MTTETCVTEAVELGELLAMRLCHDMAGMCGTLLGALDIAAEDPQALPEALPLAQETATELAGRLRLLRAAWGPPGDSLDAAALRALAAGLPGAHRLQLDFSGFAPATVLPPAAARLALNALLLGAEALPLGGTLSLSGDSAMLAIAIDGRRTAWPQSLADLVAAPHRASRLARQGGSRGLLAPLLALLAEACRARLGLEQQHAGGAAPVLRIELEHAPA